ncbi:MAG: hypothetical protein IJ560_02085 [Alphaproteobacteria bacterium]|nr:hypothetical protein [Alphaproteobacteria bacterium]
MQKTKVVNITKHCTKKRSFFCACVIAAIMVCGTANAADNSSFCELVKQLQSVFKTLRTMAFVGAGFILAKYGWDAISTNKIGGKDNIADGLKAIGVPMIVGFSLLFAIGVIIGFLIDGHTIINCPELTQGW